MSREESLYTHIQQMREVERKTTQRVMVAGYFNEEELKKITPDIEQYIKKSLEGHHNLQSFVYTKGIFYIHIIESSHIADINHYLSNFQGGLLETPALANSVRVVHQSYENAHPYFQGYDCSNNPQAGPMLSDTDKTEEQIQDRSFEIYEMFMGGAQKKMENPSYKVGTMIVLSNDDMSLLVSDHFMSLGEYLRIYCGEMNVDRQAELDYPLPPSFFDVMEYLEISDYKAFKAK